MIKLESLKIVMEQQIILYIDPGTGSLLLQMVIGGIVASSLFFKNIWVRVFSVFKKKKDSEE